MNNINVKGIVKTVVLLLIVAAGAIGICFAVSSFLEYSPTALLEACGVIFLIIGGLCAFGGSAAMKMDMNDNVTRIRAVGQRAYEEEKKLKESGRLFFVGMAVIGVLLFLIPVFM